MELLSLDLFEFCVVLFWTSGVSETGVVEKSGGWVLNEFSLKEFVVVALDELVWLLSEALLVFFVSTIFFYEVYIGSNMPIVAKVFLSTWL